MEFRSPDLRRFGEARFVAAGFGTATAVQNHGDIPASPVIVGPDPVTAGSIWWAGKNDLNVGRTAAHLTKVIQRKDATVAYWNSHNQDFLVLGHFDNAGIPDSDDGRTQLEVDDAESAAKYGARYIDVQALLASPDV